MFKLYRKSQNAQRQWIRNHPIQYVVLNTVLIVVGIGYMEYVDRRNQRKPNHEITQ
jgi:hypothetical protein